MIFRYTRFPFPAISTAAILISVCATVSARIWKSADGAKSFEGELVSYDPATGTVGVKTEAGLTTFNQNLLSSGDVEYLKSRSTQPEQPSAGRTAKSAGHGIKPVVPDEMQILLEDKCFDCHEDGTEKGDVRLDNLADLPMDEWLEMLNRMQEQVYFEQMPPPKKKSQPSEEEREQLVAWMSKELHAHNASKLEDKLRYAAYGNFVDHGKLFSGEIKDSPFSPARRWLVSPQIFDQRVYDVFGLEGRDRGIQMYGVTNPFLLVDGSGVRDYDTGLLDGGHLLVMLTNADWISSKQIRPARVKAGEIKAGDFPDPKDKWSPRETPLAFETVILNKSAPSDAEMTEAIRTQFSLVLRREPTSGELGKYLDLTRSSIELGGNSEGLRQMLLAVLLESEFLYRLEFGDGPLDGQGRKMLSPREAAYAISYALGDRGPDAKLLEASASGKLSTRDDYRREVVRLLDDGSYYAGRVDPGLAGVKTWTTSHPRINRFFRDFFGYPMAVKVFKDTERTGGIYNNPDRGTFGTPGHLVDEADRIVDLHLRNDRDVFASLLTTDEYFVFHNMGNDEGEKLIAGWRRVYEKFKDADWRNNPDQIVEENKDFIRQNLGNLTPEKDARRHGNSLVRVMTHFENTFGKGRTPFTTFPWAHGNPHWHSEIYNLPLLPGRDRKYSDSAAFDYHPVQPFKIGNRMGMLTHPAWLIAHSHNTQNDPVVRGRWVREKLLAGRVPDVPITVDAVIPEDHGKTLRSRLELKTQDQECWKCHQYMNPLGLPFEAFDDFGRYRIEELLEYPENITGKSPDNRFTLYKSLPVDTHGSLEGTGNPQLDGEVKDAFDLIGRIAKSERARQSIIRYAFRFYMGRNEMLSDSRTLIEADKAYVDSGGSFRAVIISLLTSDSFMYRKSFIP